MPSRLDLEKLRNFKKLPKKQPGVDYDPTIVPKSQRETALEPFPQGTAEFDRLIQEANRQLQVELAATHIREEEKLTEAMARTKVGGAPALIIYKAPIEGGGLNMDLLVGNAALAIAAEDPNKHEFVAEVQRLVLPPEIADAEFKDLSSDSRKQVVEAAHAIARGEPIERWTDVKQETGIVAGIKKLFGRK